MRYQPFDPHPGNSELTIFQAEPSSARNSQKYRAEPSPSHLGFKTCEPSPAELSSTKKDELSSRAEPKYK